MNYKEYLELQDNIKIGEEISLYYEGEEYWISRSQEGQFLLTRSKDSSTQFFNTADELFERGTINGHLLRNVYLKID